MLDEFLRQVKAAIDGILLHAGIHAIRPVHGKGSCACGDPISKVIHQRFTEWWSASNTLADNLPRRLAHIQRYSI